MTTLETLLVRADAAASQDGESRSWLFHLLNQGPPGDASPPNEASLLSAADPKEGASSLPAFPLGRPVSLDLEQTEIPFPPSPDLKQAPESDAAIAPDPTPATPVDQTKDSPDDSPPSEEGMPDLEPRSRLEAPAPAQHDEVASESSSPSPAAFAPEASTFASTAPSRDGSFASASASAALDQAFAPLEIAFPPLPTRNRSEATPPPAKPTPPLSPSLATPAFTVPLAVTTPSARRDAGDGEASVAPAPAVELEQDHEPLLDDFPAGAAAPVPTFHVDAPPERESLDRLKRRQPDVPGDRQAPSRATKALDAWRAWLPGPFRSRSRP